LRIFKLEITDPVNNPSKTKIKILPSGLAGTWVSENADSLTFSVVVVVPPVSVAPVSLFPESVVVPPEP
jgi:hypothetical protein